MKLFRPSLQNHEDPEPSSAFWLFAVGFLLLVLSVPETVFLHVYNLFDFRLWPWWYFPCLLVGLLFSVRWFLLYCRVLNDELDPQDLEEAKWFCTFTGTIVLILAAMVLVDRLKVFRWLFYPLYQWLGFGTFTYYAFFVFLVIVSVGVALGLLAWRWIQTIPVK